MKLVIAGLAAVTGLIGMGKTYRAYDRLSDEDREFLSTHPKTEEEYDQERLHNSALVGTISACVFPITLPYFGVRGLSELIQHPIRTSAHITMGSIFILEKKENDTYFRCRLNDRLKMDA